MADTIYAMVELNSIVFDPSGEFVEIRMISHEGERVVIAMQPDMAHIMAVQVLEERRKTANAGIFPELDQPNQRFEILATPHATGVDIAMDLGPHRTQLNFQLSRDRARKLGQRLLALADDPGSDPPRAH